MDSSSTGGVGGALDTQRNLALRLINSGAAAAPQPGGDAATEQMRAAAMQDRGVGQKVNIAV